MDAAAAPLPAALSAALDDLFRVWMQIKESGVDEEAMADDLPAALEAVPSGSGRPPAGTASVKKRTRVTRHEPGEPPLPWFHAPRPHRKLLELLFPSQDALFALQSLLLAFWNPDTHGKVPAWLFPRFKGTAFLSLTASSLALSLLREFRLLDERVVLTWDATNKVYQPTRDCAITELSPVDLPNLWKALQAAKAPGSMLPVPDASGGGSRGDCGAAPVGLPEPVGFTAADPSAGGGASAPYNDYTDLLELSESMDLPLVDPTMGSGVRVSRRRRPPPVGFTAADPSAGGGASETEPGDEAACAHDQPPGQLGFWEDSVEVPLAAPTATVYRNSFQNASARRASSAPPPVVAVAPVSRRRRLCLRIRLAVAPVVQVSSAGYHCTRHARAGLGCRVVAVCGGGYCCAPSSGVAFRGGLPSCVASPTPAVCPGAP
jgi:hypothetical protein